VAHEVAAGHVGVDPTRRADAVDRAREVRARRNQPPGHEALADDLAGVVDVIDEVVQRADPLGQAALYVSPFLTADHPRHEVQWEGTFVGGAAAAAGLKRDALLHEDRIAPAARLDQPLGAQAPELVDERLGGSSRRSVRLEQLVQEREVGPVSIDRRCLYPGDHQKSLTATWARSPSTGGETAPRPLLICHRRVG
jgi:hypothetical protein